MIIQKAIEQGKKKLAKISSTPGLDAELLLCHVLKKSREEIFTSHDEKIKREDMSSFKTMVEKRTTGVPIAYLTNSQEFYGIPIYVNKSVLIPRPETEDVLEDAIETWHELKDIGLILDVGTGSGCIAIALAKTLEEVKVVALEHCKKAVKVAAKNIHNLDLEKQIHLIESDILSKLPKKYISTKKIIVANLPYIGTQKNSFISDEVKKHEPKKALFGGKDGLELYEKLLKQIISKKVSFEAMFFEIGFSQTEDVEKLIKSYLPKASIRILRDLAGFPRTVKILP